MTRLPAAAGRRCSHRPGRAASAGWLPARARDVHARTRACAHSSLPRAPRPSRPVGDGPAATPAAPSPRQIARLDRPRRPPASRRARAETRPTSARLETRTQPGPRRPPGPSPPRTRCASGLPPSSQSRPTPSNAQDPDLDALLKAWPAIVDRLSQHPPTKPLILKCRPVAVDGAIVTLGFPEEQAFLKEQAERRRPGIEAGIAEVIGHPVTVRCVVANIELAEPSDDLVAEARRIFAEELADVGEIS